MVGAEGERQEGLPGPVSESLFPYSQPGAKITDSFGQPLKAGDSSKGVVVSNGLIHEELLESLNQ